MRNEIGSFSLEYDGDWFAFVYALFDRGYGCADDRYGMFVWLVVYCDVQDDVGVRLVG